MDTLANFFSNFQNSQMKRKSSVLIPFSQRIWSICNLLFIHGFIQGFTYELKDSKGFTLSSYNKVEIHSDQIIRQDHYSTQLKDTVNYEGQPCIRIFLKYLNNKAVITKISKISLQSKKIYVKKISFLDLSTKSNISGKNNKSTIERFGLKILSTSKGILSEQEAKFFGVGGEVLCKVI